MKKNKIFLSLILTTLLFSCAEPNNNSISTSSSKEISTSNSSSSEEEIPSDPSIKEIGEVIKGAFGSNDESSIYSKRDSSVLKLNQSFSYGTLIYKFKTFSSFSENGILLHVDDELNPQNYYFLGFDIVGRFALTKFENGQPTPIYREKVNDDYNKRYVTLGINLDEEAHKIDLYYNNVNVGSYFEENFLAGNKVMIKANGINSYFKDMEFDSQDTYLQSAQYYSQASGSFVQTEEGSFVSAGTNNLCVSSSIKFVDGALSVDMELSGQDSDNGIVFALNDSNKETYWEGSGIEYYFFFASLSGLAYLGKTANGSWTVCATRQIQDFNNAGKYNIKISKANDTILCFINNELYLAYTDPTPLSGTGFGLRAGARGIKYTNLKLNKLLEDDKTIVDSYNVGSGSIDTCVGAIKSSSAKTLAFVKNSSFTNGTLETDFVPGSNSPAGIVFKGTYPEAGEYYEKEQGLSYYFLYVEDRTCSFNKVENGVITKTNNKYWPYGISTCYHARIIVKGLDIYCYLNDRLVFHYHDENMLQGDKYGLKSRLPGCLVTEFTKGTNEEKDKTDYLIFGHSYTDFWIPTYKQDFSEYENIYNIGIAGALTANWCEEGYQNEVVAYEPKWGIYWNGINDINGNISSETIGANVRRMCEGMHAKLPNFKLVLIGICRCPFDSSANRRQDITNANNYYKQIANDLDYVFYIDTELMYCDSSGNEIASYFTDGLHPTHEAYLMAAERIKNVINEN